MIARRTRHFTLMWPPFPLQPLSLAEVPPPCALPGCHLPVRIGSNGLPRKFCSPEHRSDAQSAALSGKPFGRAYDTEDADG